MFSFGSTTNTSSPQTSTSFGGFGSSSSFASQPAPSFGGFGMTSSSSSTQGPTSFSLKSSSTHSLINLSSKKSSNENDLIWIQGTGASSTGSVLVNLAQTGYTREAHQIISLSRIASLIGRDSDGGLPELWDVMGKVRGKKGITRLMAICITRGRDSPHRARALIRDHNVNVREEDEKGRTALHLALGARDENSSFGGFGGDLWPKDTPINIELIRVLLELYPDGVKVKNNIGELPLHTACEKNAPIDVIKLLIDLYPDGVKEKNIYDGSLPLHTACQNNAPIDVIQFLYDKYKEGASITDSYGKVPAHYLSSDSPSLSVLPSPPPLPPSTTSVFRF